MTIKTMQLQSTSFVLVNGETSIAEESIVCIVTINNAINVKVQLHGPDIEAFKKLVFDRANAELQKLTNEPLPTGSNRRT